MDGDVSIWWTLAVALVSGGLGTVLGAAIGSILNHVLAGRARRDERQYSALLREEQEARDTRRKRDEERIDTLRALQGLLTELRLNEQALLEWQLYLGWDFASDGRYGEPVKPVSLFEFDWFQRSRPEIGLLPRKVREPVVKSYVKARQFQALTERYADSESPDIDLAATVSRSLADPLNEAIRELSLYVFSETVWSEERETEVASAEKSPE